MVSMHLRTLLWPDGDLSRLVHNAKPDDANTPTACLRGALTRYRSETSAAASALIAASGDHDGFRPWSRRAYREHEVSVRAVNAEVTPQRSAAASSSREPCTASVARMAIVARQWSLRTSERHAPEHSGHCGHSGHSDHSDQTRAEAHCHGGHGHRARAIWPDAPHHTTESAGGRAKQNVRDDSPTNVIDFTSLRPLDPAVTSRIYNRFLQRCKRAQRFVS